MANCITVLLLKKLKCHFKTRPSAKVQTEHFHHLLFFVSFLSFLFFFTSKKWHLISARFTEHTFSIMITVSMWIPFSPGNLLSDKPFAEFAWTADGETEGRAAAWSEADANGNKRRTVSGKDDRVCGQKTWWLYDQHTARAVWAR